MKSTKSLLALLLLATLALLAQARTYYECSLNAATGCTFDKTNLCTGNFDNRPVYFDRNVECCRCYSDDRCFGCDDDDDCFGDSCSSLATWIIVIAIVIPAVIVGIIVLIVICCCCCAAAAAASGSHSNSGSTVIVTQPQPNEQVYVEAPPQYVQTNQTVELQPVGTDAYGRPVYQQQAPPPPYAAPYAY